jgi:hypothetical protein
MVMMQPSGADTHHHLLIYLSVYPFLIHVFLVPTLEKRLQAGSSRA